MDFIENNEGELVHVDGKGHRWTVKARRFVYYYARIGNVKEATTKAGFSDSSYGGTLLQKPHIQAAIGKELRNIMLAENETEESVVARWSNWAELDVGDYFTPGWTLKDNDDLTINQRKRIKKVSIKEHQHGRDVNIEFHDPHKANNDLATFLGMLSKGDEGSTAPEELAKYIRGCLQDMDDTDALLEEAPGGADGGDGSPTTH